MAVIFDMDGVLVDSERVVWESFRYAGEKTGVPDVERMAIIGPWTQRRGVDQTVPAGIRRGCGPNPGARGGLSAEFLRQWSSSGKKRRAAAAGAAVRVEYPGCSRVVVSGGRRARRLERVGLLQYFTAVISGDMVGRSKPEPDIFLEAARQLGSPAALCTVIEDSPNGLRASRRAGCRTLFVPDLWQPEEEHPELYDALLCRSGRRARIFCCGALSSAGCGGRNLQQLAVFCHGAARDVDALRLQPLGKRLIGQGSVLILLLHKHGDGLLCHDAGDLTACQLCGKQAAQAGGRPAASGYTSR